MKIKTLGIITALTLTLSACAPVESETIEPFDGLTIVSSTNVWGDIAKSVAGDGVRVISIIDSFGQDPHSYEASARDQLAVNEADIVVANGGGYDSFIDVLADAAGGFEILYAYLPDEHSEEEATAEESTEDGHDHGHENEHSEEEATAEESTEDGHDHGHENVHSEEEATAEESTEDGHDHGHENEHVWYDFHVVEDFATRLAEQLGTLDPDGATEYAENLVEFLGEMERLQDDVAMAGQNYQGYSVLSSEPVADYLIDALGFENVTPSEFSQAIEEETDLSPKVLLEVQELLKNKLVKLFVVNSQTGSSQIDSLVALAKDNGIAVVEMSELLPEGISYSEWMHNNILSIDTALN
jgi:zinc/manganese transport system substrate-binding protein